MNTSPVPTDLKISKRALILGSGCALTFAATEISAFSQTRENANEPIVQPKVSEKAAFIQRAFDMRQLAVDLGDQPYGAIIVKENVIIGQSWSKVILDQDPTAHAELAAIRDAAQRTKSRNLAGSVLYSSSRPCPMCEAAAYWAGIDDMIHGRSADRAGRPHLCN